MLQHQEINQCRSTSQILILRNRLFVTVDLLVFLGLASIPAPNELDGEKSSGKIGWYGGWSGIISFLSQSVSSFSIQHKLWCVKQSIVPVIYYAARHESIINLLSWLLRSWKTTHTITIRIYSIVFTFWTAPDT